MGNWFPNFIARLKEGGKANEDDKKKVIIHSWSTPRTLSTATMYSFAQREDTRVYDEPLYPAYLDANTHVERPYRQSLLSSPGVCKDANDALRMLDESHDLGGKGETRRQDSICQAYCQILRTWTQPSALIWRRSETHHFASGPAGNRALVVRAG